MGRHTEKRIVQQESVMHSLEDEIFGSAEEPRRNERNFVRNIGAFLGALVLLTGGVGAAREVTSDVLPQIVQQDWRTFQSYFETDER